MLQDRNNCSYLLHLFIGGFLCTYILSMKAILNVCFCPCSAQCSPVAGAELFASPLPSSDKEKENTDPTHDGRLKKFPWQISSSLRNWNSKGLYNSGAVTRSSLFRFSVFRAIFYNWKIFWDKNLSCLPHLGRDVLPCVHVRAYQVRLFLAIWTSASFVCTTKINSFGRKSAVLQEQPKSIKANI